MEKDTTYTIAQYWRNGKRIDALTAGAVTEYYLMMSINTPAGTLAQSPRIEADSIESAYEAAPAIEAMVIDAVKRELSGNKIVTANRLPASGGPISGIIMP